MAVSTEYYQSVMVGVTEEEFSNEIRERFPRRLSNKKKNDHLKNMLLIGPGR